MQRSQNNYSLIENFFKFSISATFEMLPPSPVPRDQLHNRIDSLMQQNRVLKVELETFKLRVKALQEENKALKLASVHIQVHPLVYLCFLF